MRERSYTVVCLTSDGIGPEIMAEASRALQAVADMHGFRVRELHVPFAGDAVRRFGEPFPAVTRVACRSADAVLVASTKSPLLAEVKASFELAWRVQRVCVAPREGLVLVSPLSADAEEKAIDRAFTIARSRRARLASVATGKRWKALVAETSERYDGIAVEHLTLEAALPLLTRRPEYFDVVVTGELFAEALAEMVAYAQEAPRAVASGRLAPDFRGVFGPTHGSEPEIAGQGIANPSGILLAAALMLSEALGERGAARTLDRAVAEALAGEVRTADMLGAGTAATTREFGDSLLARLPEARGNVEFCEEAIA